MTLADTSVWIDHFRHGNARLERLLEDGQVVIHPMILGELACGHLPQRAETLRLLGHLPRVPQAPDALVLQSVDARRFRGAGIGWIDAHLLAASVLSAVPLWTLDRRLALLRSEERRVGKEC